MFPPVCTTHATRSPASARLKTVSALRGGGHVHCPIGPSVVSPASGPPDADQLVAEGEGGPSASRVERLQRLAQAELVRRDLDERRLGRLLLPGRDGRGEHERRKRECRSGDPEHPILLRWKGSVSSILRIDNPR